MTNNNVKPSKNLKMAAGLVASAAAATIAAMAYKVNEDKINAGVDKVADGAKAVIEKTSKKVKSMADDLMAKVDEETTAETGDAAEAEIVEVDAAEVEVVEEKEE
jgi:hypothetical protein